MLRRFSGGRLPNLLVDGVLQRPPDEQLQLGAQDIDSAEVRALAEKAGAFCYCRDHNAAVYAARHLIGICAPETGTYTLRLPEARTWIPLFDQKKVKFTGTETVLDLERGEVAAFWLE